MRQSDRKSVAGKLAGMKGGLLLEELSRIVVPSDPAPNRKAASAADFAYGITSAKKLGEAFTVKRHLAKNTS